MLKWIVIVATIIFWGLAFTAIKYAVVSLSPITIATLRFAIANVLFTILVITGRRIKVEDIPSVFTVGLFGVTIYHTCLNIGEKYISSGVASLIISLAPIFVLILSWMFLDEKMNLWKVAGTIVAFLGIVIISELSYSNIFGIGIVLVSAISAALYTVMGKKLMKRYDAITLTTNAMILGSIPLFFFLPNSIYELYSNLTVEMVLSIVFLGVFSTYLGYLGWYYFLEREEASKASVFLLAIPVVSLIAGYIILGEEVTIRTLIGAVVTVVGIYVVLKAK